MTQDMIDGYNPAPDFEMTKEQMSYAEKKMHLFTNFVKRNGITDEDLMQDLYITYCYIISKIYDNGSKIDTINIISGLHAYYIRALRRKEVREELKRSLCDIKGEWYDEAYHEKDELNEILESIMSSDLRPREQQALVKYYGLDGGDGSTLEKVAKEMNVTRERVRQIMAKGIRRMRNAENIEILKDYLTESLETVMF